MQNILLYASVLIVFQFLFYFRGYMRNGPGMMGIMDRPPLSREEFLEVQERQRQERHRQQRMLEHSERSVDMALITLIWNYCIWEHCTASSLVSQMVFNFSNH